MHLTPLIIFKFARHVKVLACILGFLPGGQYAPASSTSRRMELSAWDQEDVRRPDPGPCWSAIAVGLPDHLIGVGEQRRRHHGQ
jgi:hypothetical protein